MTDAKVLADALVEVGILDYVGNHHEMSRPGYTELGRFYWVKGDEGMEDDALGHDEIITDWRVAGMVLESMDSSEVCDVVEASFGSVRELITPRAIIEAWYAATEQGDTDE